jgi:hypothetical protein
MKSKGPKFSALSAAMGALGGNSANQSQQVGMNAVTAGPLDRMRGMFGQSKQPTVSSTGQNIFGQSKQPTTGAMGAMDQANSQSLMGQDKIGCSDGMMAKSPLRAEGKVEKIKNFEYDRGDRGLAGETGGAYVNPTTASEPSGGNITAAVGGAIENVTSSLITSDGKTNDPVKVNNPAKQARIDGRNERKLIRQTHRSKKTIIKNEKKKNNLIERLG